MKIINKIKELKPDTLVFVYDDADDQIILLAERTPQQIRALVESESWIQARLFTAGNIVFSERREIDAGEKPDFVQFLELMLRSQESIANSFKTLLESNNKNMENILASNQRILERGEQKIERLEERHQELLDIQTASALPPEQSEDKSGLSAIIELAPLIKDFFGNQKKE